MTTKAPPRDSSPHPDTQLGGGPAAEGAAQDALHHPHTQPLSLVDMPSAWLIQLPGQISRQQEAEEEEGHPELVPLIRTCRALRDLVLSQCTIRLELFLPIPPDQAPAAQDKLLLACKYADKVTLQLGSAENEEYGLVDVVPDTTANTLMLGAMAAAGHGLDAITSVVLRDLDINTLVPSWLALTCPRMTDLELHGCQHNSLPPATASVVPNGQVSKLTLVFRAGEPADQSTLPRWQHQLRALTGLTSLKVATSMEEQEEGYTTWFLECCSTVGSALSQWSPARTWGRNTGLCSHVTSQRSAQLTALTWRCTNYYMVGQCLSDLQRLGLWCPHLAVLQLHDTVIDDQGMEVLLSMQRLQRFSCGTFQLQHSYTHRCFLWKHLGVNHLDISAFDRLPVEGLQSIEGVHGCIKVIPSPDLGASSRVAAAVARIGGITTKWLELDNEDSQADSASLAAAMAVVACCQAAQFTLQYISPVTPELLTAISQHLPSTNATSLHFWFCTLSPGVWPLLLPTLPFIDRLRYHSVWDPHGPAEPSEEQATAMCVHACRPVAAYILLEAGRWQPGWQQRVQVAMAAAGHQHVQLEVYRDGQ